MSSSVFLGIDVGTGSARAGLFDKQGVLLASAKHPVRTWYEAGEIVEQSTDDIWAAVAKSVKAAIGSAGIVASDIAGVGVDATCSLAVVDQNGLPVPVGPSNDAQRNVIVWMDHRATEQAERINATGHPVLHYVGGKLSPEMQTPKLLWLKENKPDSFASAAHFFDLSDYLTWRMTGSLARSVCTVTCKWTYLAHERRWDESYFHSIGLGELTENAFEQIGSKVVAAGTPLAGGLTSQAALDFGMNAGTPVGAGLIDAHAGGIGTVGASGLGPLENSIAYIFGTSACAMATTREPTYVKGIWGPYYSAMVPDLWLNEAGQSAAGAAIDQLIHMHPASPEADILAAEGGMSLVAWLEQQAVIGGSNLSEPALRARSVHVLPDFLGNRSPNADPDARAIIAGADANRDVSGLVDLYVAGLCGLGYGCRQIIDALKEQGIDIAIVVASGGAAQSELVRQILADTTGVPVAVPTSSEPVLLGAAILGAMAAGAFSSTSEAMGVMSHIDKVYHPGGNDIAQYHHSKMQVYRLLQIADWEIRQLMKPL
ncbi:FGGY-family carbohydrate kinase [Phyllobacterium sp. OV277]|uniref:FGGY-family carbohydrate kinase n=1 Tax=Phyllobacterium sp. OV277 TaxID=1882772 RepID=UPI000B8498C2|nr:FGGY-family carbohydrate kinase [Phyllobacterium sp. OV277]